MKLFIVKITKMILLGFTPLLLISSAGGEGILEHGFKGMELLVTFGEDEICLPYGLVYQERLSALEDGSFFPSLVISVPKNTCAPQGHKAMELVISQGDGREIGKGQYSITGVSSFLEPYSNVFGVANYDAWGELPFFATSGEIRIAHKEDQQIYGYLQMVCENQKGDQLTIEGPFMAQRSAVY
jgi:hypothetical protein